MQVTRTFKRIIFLELAIPVALLTIGIYHGLMQTIYRAGVLHDVSFLKLDPAIVASHPGAIWIQRFQRWNFLELHPG